MISYGAMPSRRSYIELEVARGLSGADLRKRVRKHLALLDRQMQEDEELSREPGAPPRIYSPA
jgi:hypothetical protein